MRHRHAFSLVELLVVIGIIGILISLLLPSLSRVRESARQVQCAAQLRQIGQAMMTYAAENNGVFPGASGWHIYGGDGTPPDSAGPGWTEIIKRYLGSPQTGIYRCPGFPEGISNFNYFIAARWTMISGRTHLKISDIKTSSTFVLSADCTGHKLYAPDFGISVESGDDCDKDDGSSPGLEFSGEMYGMNLHRAGNNILFGDYHVAPFKAYDERQITYNPRRMENWEDVTAD